MEDLTPRDIAEFRDLFQLETGRTIDDDTAERYARNLIRLVETVVRLDPGRSSDPSSPDSHPLR